MGKLNFKFVLLDDDGEMLKGKDGEIMAFEDGNQAMQYNKMNEHKHHVMQVIPEREYKWENNKLIVRAK